MSTRELQQKIDAVRWRLAATGERLRRTGELAGELEATLSQLAIAEEELTAMGDTLRAAQLEQDLALLRYRELFEQSPDAYLATDPQGVIAEASHAAEELLGLPRDSLVGRPLSTWVSRAQAAAYHARVRALDAGRVERIQDWQVTVQPTEGEPFEAEVTVEPTRGPDGEVTGLRWLLRDVTERRSGEELLRESEARFRALFETSSIGILMCRAEGPGRIIAANDAFVRMVGYTEDELRARTVADITHPEDVERHLELLREVVERTRDSFRLEKRYRRKDGAVFWGRLTVSPVRGGGGELRYLAGFVEDVTARREAQEALRRERDFAESLVETAQAVVLVLDERGRIVRFNHYLEELTGFRLEEVQGQDWFSTFLPEGDRPEIRELFAEALGGRRVQGHVNPIVTRNGGRREIEWQGTVLRDAEGRVTGLLSIGHDITDRRRLEEQFLQAQKMEAIGRLAGGVAHDFNTLLATITGYSEMLLDRLPRTSAHRREAEQIRRAAERGAALTRRLLAFSRRQPVRPARVDLRRVLAEMDDMLRRLIGENVEVEVDLDPGLGLVEIDTGQLEQVILNLVVNASDAMPHGGTLSISVSNVDVEEGDSRHVHGVTPGRYLELTVADTGTGMSEETRDRLFEPFFTTKEVGKGTGLGLSTVYGIVEGGEGTITVETTPGEGSVFRVYLPRLEEETAVAPPPAPVASRSERRGSETVLLVEDDDMFRDLLEETLVDHGYQVLAASRPGTALETSEELEGEIHLLITDVVMPGMSGHELAAELVSRHPDMKVMLMSGYAGDEYEEPGIRRRLGGAGFLQKPFGGKDLLRAIRDLLDEPAPA